MIARWALELHPRVRAVMAGLLLVLVSLAVPLEASQPLHIHEAGTAGLYNEEHVLAELGSLHRIVSLPEGAPAIVLALRTTAAVVSARVHPHSPDASRAGPRAPPSA